MRFVASKAGRYWVVTDTETGATWPHLNEAGAQFAADASNADPTHMRQTAQINTPPSPVEEDTSV